MSPLEENQNSRSRSQRKHDLVEHCIFLSMSSSCICLSAYKLQSGCRVTSKTDLRSSKIQVNKALWKKPNWYPKFQTSRQTSVWGMTLLALEKWIYNIIQHRLYYNIQHVIQFFISKIFQKIICFFFWSCQLTCFLTGLPHKYIFYCKRLHYFESSYHKNTHCLFLSLMKRSIPPPPFNHFKTCPLEGLQS